MANYSSNTIIMKGIGKEDLFKKQKDCDGKEVLEFDLSCINVALNDFNGDYVSNTKIDDDSINFLLYRDTILPKEFLEAFSKKYSDKKITYIYSPESEWLTDYIYEFLNGELIKEHKEEKDMDMAMKEANDKKQGLKKIIINKDFKYL